MQATGVLHDTYARLIRPSRNVGRMRQMKLETPPLRNAQRRPGLAHALMGAARDSTLAEA